MDLKEIGMPSEMWEIGSSLQTLICVAIISQSLTFSIFELMLRMETKICNAVSRPSRIV